MPRKTRFIALDWLSTSNTAPDRTPFDNTPGVIQKSANVDAQSLAVPDLTGATHVPLKVVEDSDGVHSGSPLHDTEVTFGLQPLADPLSLSRSSLPPLQRPKTPQPGGYEHLQAVFGKINVTEDRSINPASAGAQPPIHRGLSEENSLVALSNARPTQSPYPGPYTSPSRAQDASMARSASLPALSARPHHKEKLWPRKPIQEVPVPGKIYFVPDGRYFPDSIIHAQKDQVGFFRHPIMILDVEDTIVTFYAMTKEPPPAIRDLNMAMRLGTNAADAGPAVLRLAPGSEIMLQETWINLEQRFFIEWRNLDEWAANVRVDPSDFSKISARVLALEAQQNRFLYKPLLRAMHSIQPGTIIMLPNRPGSATFGAPIIVVENTYPDFTYLRVKRFEDNIHFNPAAKRLQGSPRRMSLAITKVLRLGHDGTPVMVLEPDSPAMREASYVEVQASPVRGGLDACRTWCWPPVCVDRMSMVILKNYVADAAGQVGSGAGSPPGWYRHGQGRDRAPVQRIGYPTGPQMVVPVYPAGNYMFGASNVFRQDMGPGSGRGGT